MKYGAEIEHFYGNNIHLIDDPLALALLSKVCSPQTHQPDINRLIGVLYRHLVHVVIANELTTCETAQETRMIQYNKEAIWRGQIIDPKAQVTVVSVARAGIYPSQVCFDFLNDIMEPQNVRQDHFFMNRTTTQEGAVSGAALHGAKVGGPIDNSTVLIPDPMGATGSTFVTLLDHYKKHVPGAPRKVISLNLIVTPEYLRRLREGSPNALVYAFRLDRGLSPENVLKAPPGKHWDQERGLNEKQYIVPGGGGIGELMNNSFV